MFIQNTCNALVTADLTRIQRKTTINQNKKKKVFILKGGELNDKFPKLLA
jgi:hypothetical protein